MVIRKYRKNLFFIDSLFLDIFLYRLIDIRIIRQISIRGKDMEKSSILANWPKKKIMMVISVIVVAINAIVWLGLKRNVET